MKAKSIKGKSDVEIKTALEQSMADGFTPAVAIVLLEADIAHEEVCAVLSAKEIQIFGCSSGSNFTDGEIESGFIVILLLDIKQEYFQLLFHIIILYKIPLAGYRSKDTDLF